MIKKILCLVLCLAFSSISFSQKNLDPSSTDKATAKALKEKFPDDNVALLISKTDVTFGFDNKSKKVTVTNKLDETLINLDSRSDIQKYSFYDGESEITEFKIRYKNKRAAKGFFIKDEAYTSDDLFHNDTRVKYTHLDFPLFAYKYHTTIHKEYKDIKYFTSVYFHGDYPTEEQHIKITVPNWLELELKEINFENYDISKKEETSEKGDSKIYTFTLNNVEAFAKDERAPGPSYIYPHIMILAKSQSKNGEKQVIFNSTQDLYNWYSSLTSSLKNDRSAFKDKVAELIKNAKDDTEKIKNIYYWVQDNIRYIAFEDGIAGFKPDEAANVFTKKYGDCKGMANLTKQMLIEAGFDARLTWIGTKRIAYDYSTPNLSVDNHMICTLSVDGKPYFLDGTEKFNSFGEYADRIQGKQVLIENGDDFILAKVPESDAEFNKETINYNLKIENDNIIGSVEKHFKGESRSSLLYYFNQIQNDQKEDFLDWYLNSGNKNIEVSNVSTSDLNNRDIPVDLSYDIKLKNAISSFDGTIYLDLDFEKEFAQSQLKERKTDYIFSFKRNLESTTHLELPSGYGVSELPKDIDVSTKNYDISIRFSKQANTLVYKKIFTIKNAKIETSDFENWNKTISQLSAVYNEQIILTKK